MLSVSGPVLRRAPGPRAMRACGVLAFLVLVAPLLLQHLRADPSHWLVDLMVYREAGVSLLLGRPVYDYLTPYPQLLPFTYPPFAALLALPLAVLPARLAGALWTALTLVLLLVVARSAFGPALRRTGRWLPMALGVLAGALAWMLPLRDTVRFGQVSLVLLALVLADCTARSPRWPRGALIGVAAAIKLTPGIFIPYLWLSGRRRAAVTAAAVFAALTAATALVLPGTSRAYWLGALLDPSRLGRNAGTSNQSLRGMLLRAELPYADIGDTRIDPVPQETGSMLVVWALLAAFVAGVGLLRAARAARAGDELTGLAIVGLLAVVVSPVSWIHHLAWAVLLVAAVAADGASRRRLWAAGAIWLFLVLKFPWWAAGRAEAGTPPELFWRLLQDSYGLAALAIVLFLPWRGQSVPDAAPQPWSAVPAGHVGGGDR